MTELIGFATKPGSPRLNLEKTPKGYRTNLTGSFSYVYTTLGDLTGFLKYQGYEIEIF
jgi:hypothetical protein